MGPVDVVVILAVALVVVLAVRRFVGGVSGRRDCCSGDERDGGPVRMPRPADTNPDHYPYAATLEISGMTCERCAARVAGALDGLGGTWAEVDLASGTARLRAKGPISEQACRSAVEGAGYGLVSLRPVAS